MGKCRLFPVYQNTEYTYSFLALSDLFGFGQFWCVVCDLVSGFLEALFEVKDFRFHLSRKLGDKYHFLDTVLQSDCFVPVLHYFLG